MSAELFFFIYEALFVNENLLKNVRSRTLCGIIGAVI